MIVLFELFGRFAFYHVVADWEVSRLLGSLKLQKKLFRSTSVA
jgi:hypothetical protein